LHHRKVLVYDDKLTECGRPTKFKKEPYEGHFEKAITKDKTYFYVEGDQKSTVKKAKKASEAEELFIRSKL